MPNPNAIVGRVLRLEPSAEESARGERVVILGGDQRARLDPNDAKSAGIARILEGIARLSRPVYLENNPATGFIKRFLIPAVSRVARLLPRDDGSLDVLLEMSHAIRRLNKGSSDYANFSELLRNSERDTTALIVTFEDDGTIIDVRGFRPGPDGDLPRFPERKWPPLKWIEDLLRWIFRWPFWPWRWRWWFGCVSWTRAQKIFDAMAATTCAPLTVPAPCIPFLYPDDGCWARAHEMVRLMLAMGLHPKKVWIQGWPLHPSTKNHPGCSVTWGWHVAPTICVRTRWIFFGRRMVIDPSLFSTPVSKATWKNVQNNPAATLTDTDGTYYNWIWSQPNDPGYADTNYYLNVYRLALQSRSLQVGPPPYANCP